MEELSGQERTRIKVKTITRGHKMAFPTNDGNNMYLEVLVLNRIFFFNSLTFCMFHVKRSQLRPSWPSVILSSSLAPSICSMWPTAWNCGKSWYHDYYNTPGLMQTSEAFFSSCHLVDVLSILLGSYWTKQPGSCKTHISYPWGYCYSVPYLIVLLSAISN